MDVRPFAPSDCESCLAIFDSHHPQDRGTRAQLERFLQHLPGPYFVLEHDGSVVGSGGYLLEPRPSASTATLTWGMIQPSLQHNGLGRFLLMYRLREIGKEPGIQTVAVTTPAPFVPFFLNQGFRLSATDPANGAASLVKKLAVCA